MKFWLYVALDEPRQPRKSQTAALKGTEDIEG
jgi:hypothetical protein